MDDAARLGVAFVNGAPYGGGILAKGPQAQPKYAYRAADNTVLAAVTAMQEACIRYEVPLRAAALRFSARDARVTATIAGVSDPSRIDDLRGLLDLSIPDDLWAELDGLAIPPERWLQ